MQSTIDSALGHHQAGRLREAEAGYRAALREQPDHPDALHLLGVLLHQQGQYDQAMQLIRQAIALRPGTAQFHDNLALVLLTLGRHGEAIAECERAIASDARDADARNIKGSALLASGRIDAAIADYREAIALRPNWAEAHSNLGNALCAAGRFAEARLACERAITIEPNLANAHNHLGNALYALKDYARAADEYRRTLALYPAHAGAPFNLGVALYALEDLEGAVSAYRTAVALQPKQAVAHNNLANALFRLGRLDEAADAARAAIALRADYAEPHNNLANVLREQGRIEEAVDAYREAVRLSPAHAAFHGSLLYSLYFHPEQTPRSILAEHRRFDEIHARPLASQMPRHLNDRSPERRLRIGYVSPDFRGHALAAYMAPMLAAHDRGVVEVFCYSDTARPDAMTQTLCSRADSWRDTSALSDAQLAQAIANDGIDILVDLTMHMAGGRPLLFARKPAPVQVAWLAYPGTTGLSAMDYRLTDPWLDPPDEQTEAYVEHSIRLPDSFWCYSALDPTLTIGAPPAMKNGYVTFGSLNSFAKVNSGVQYLWAQALRMVPRSRLRVLSPPGTHRMRMLERLDRRGIAADRIDFIERQPWPAYMRLYDTIDIVLDTFPYNGHTTSLDGLWMGVPVVSLRGQTAVSRAGWCFLSNLGLGDLAAQTPEQYVQIAAQLTGDLPRLAELRGALRARMEKSALMDAPRFARNLEAAYRAMWRRRCDA